MKTRRQPKKKSTLKSTPKQKPSPSDSPAVMAAKQAERQADSGARQARSSAEAAQREAEQAAKALNAKEMEVAEGKAKLATVSQQLGALSLDDVKAEKLGGQLRHCELRLTQLQGEAGGCSEALAVARHTAEHAHTVAEVAEAAGRNAGRWVRLVHLMEQFPLVLEQLLAVVRERTTTLFEADQESRGANLPRLGRARLFPTRDQIRGPGMDDLLTTLSRHMAGLTLSPSAPLSAFSADGQVSPEPVEEWVPVAVAGGTDDV